MECSLCEMISTLAVLYLFYRVILPLFIYIYKTTMATGLNPAKYGEWALVTGSTDGIGKAFAKALAKKGLNIVLVSRSPYKLQNVQAEIEAESKVKVKVIAVDFKQDEDSIVKAVEQGTKGLEIGVLVNNVGMSHECPNEFLDQADIDDLLNVNLVSLNIMTRAILPSMAERKKGVVINFSSMSALMPMPCPLISVYTATKAYVLKLTQGLEVEYRSKGIVFQCLYPGYVFSNMSNIKIKEPSFIAPSPETYVASALNRLGVFAATTGYLGHDMMVAFASALPESLVGKMTLDELKVIQSLVREQAKKN